jgi:hypothetical protein
MQREEVRQRRRTRGRPGSGKARAWYQSTTRVPVSTSRYQDPGCPGEEILLGVITEYDDRTEPKLDLDPDTIRCRVWVQVEFGRRLCRRSGISTSSFVRSSCANQYLSKVSDPIEASRQGQIRCHPDELSRCWGGRRASRDLIWLGAVCV